MSEKIWLALDVGGANLKAAHQSGPVLSEPFAVWKHPERLSTALSDLVGRMPPFDSVALTMTAELCDCFRVKAEGVRHVLDAASRLSGPRPLRTWGIDGRFHDPEEIREFPLLAAASNWLALAQWAARLRPEGAGLLVDIGSTTTDLIPLLDGRPVPQGRTDTDRLRTGELVYAGVKRTPLCSLSTKLVYQGHSTGLCAELFATTLDVYLVLEKLAEDPSDTDTADGRPATREFARDRLARMVGADRDQFSDSDARDLARDADQAFRDRLQKAARGIAWRVGTPGFAVVCGSGEWLAADLAGAVLADRKTITRLSEIWDRDSSGSACARALVELAQVENF